MTKQKAILFVAMPDSIHTVRWIEQISEQGWDVHLFPSLLSTAHPALRRLTIHYPFSTTRILITGRRQSPVVNFFQRILFALLRRVLSHLLPYWEAKRLANIITHMQPVVVHSLEIQKAGYLVLAAKRYCDAYFPAWIVTNWGSDIYLFGKQPFHKEKIRQVLKACNYYSCECHRDVRLAKDFGFNGTVLPVFPNTGGFDLQRLETIRNMQLTSKRKTIMLKGYQHWAGRALVGLQALQGCVDILAGYTIVIYSAAASVVKAARLFTRQTGIATKIVFLGTAHDKILSLHAQARISIGLSISDAISTSLLEAMVMGSFPIQSCTACADEWIEHGISGMIVPAEEAEIVAMHIRKALTDDNLVNRAAQINWQTALLRLDGTKIKQQAIDIYRSVTKQ